MNPGLYFGIGKKARDLLYKDYAQQQQQQQPQPRRYQSFDWSFDFSCQIAEVLPGLDTVFGVTIPDSSKAELQYFRDYVGFSVGIGLEANPNTGFNPIANVSGIIGSTLISIGADIGIDIPTGTLNNFTAGFSLNTAFLIASLTSSDGFDSVNASLYHPLNPTGRTAVAAEFEHRISDNATTVAVGLQHALFPYTMVKARMNTDGKIGAVLGQEVWQRFYISIAGEIDLRDNSNIPRVGLSMALKP